MLHQGPALRTGRRRRRGGGRASRLGLFGVALGLLLALFAGAATATAAVKAPLAAAGSGPSAATTPAAFAAQARQAGLTGAQAASLQARVNTYLSEEGGTQVAANEIRLTSGGEILLTLPGETHVRSLVATPDSGSPIDGCPYFELCAFQFQGYTGDMITAYRCGVDVYIPWIGPAIGGPWGSWVNNQTLGTVGLFLLGSGGVQGSTGPATSTHFYQDWTYVANMDPC